MFNIIFVEFLTVYSGRASEIQTSKLDYLYRIAIESFKAEKVNIKIFH